ncbi:MAG: thiolase family protein [Acidimicrobiaceae bacterium]|nr:thiolase family protein [Acidimicrobiaceae bacterium]
MWGPGAGNVSDAFVAAAELDPAQSGRYAVVGIGETDYGDDYRAARSGDESYVPPDAVSLGRRAFERALADSGLQRGDIDGLCASFTYGGCEPAALATALGLVPRHVMQGGGILPFLPAVAALAAGRCDTIAVVHALPSRAIGRQYGGQTYAGGGRDSYYYYHPWGWSSQAAHWALMFSYYAATYGFTEADLGEVAVTLRSNATRNDNATMRTPLSIEDYLASRYIVRPMRLFDLCLVNDGAVCVILTGANRARNLRQTPVLVSGWGHGRVHDSKLRSMVTERLRPQLAGAAADALGIAGVALSDVDHFEGYDASTIHLVNQLEGYGFAKPGEGLNFWKEGHTAIGGTIPTNTGGGMLSEAYLQGWNLLAEVVRQLRHDAGPRQVEDAEVSLFSFTTTESVHPIVFTRGA